ncbi:annexin A9 isoform X6 [Heterocephalus glaber]|uniref:Annexin n=1 Tax=Heterocephalus glaber TaxID=10181 RepID=A0AAX6TL36_HETGA|nr:annexin A9 isoform X6 [Heterocephalus glaber]
MKMVLLCAVRTCDCDLLHGNSLDDSAFLYALPTAHPRPAPNPSQCLLSGPSLPTTLTQEAASFTWAEPLSIRGAARDLKWPQGNSRRAVATNALLRPRWKWQVAGEPRSNFLETIKGKESAVGVQAPVLRNLGGLPGPCHLLLPSFPKPACTMSVSSGEMGPSLTQEILSHLGLVNKPAAWGTLGTLRTFLSFSVDKDVQRLLRAITGRGVDQGAILEVLTNRSREQRQLISQAFRERTQQDLLKSLRVALSGNLEWIVVALLQPLAQSDAQELRKALKGSGSAEDVAVEILATRAPPQLQECLAAYKHSFQVDAEEDIKSETSSILQDLLLALAKGGRDSYSGIIDYNLAEQDVQESMAGSFLHPRHYGKWKARGSRSSPSAILSTSFEWRTGRALEEAVRDRFHGDAQVALLSLASVVRNTPLYFADKLHRALQETEPNYQVLMRILVSRNETDLLSIRAEFKKKFGESLYSSLQRAVKGDCRPALLALCRAEDL